MAIKTADSGPDYKRVLGMDLTATIDELRREKEKLERVIAILEELRSTMPAPAPQKKRRGRKSMSAQQRREVSERMKKYWADWHNARRSRT
jgi:hypothetical protein